MIGIPVALAALALPAAGPASQQLDIPAVASDSAEFTTLVRAMEAAELVGLLESEGPFTVFAPSDAAFEQLPPGRLETLLEPGNQEDLAEILADHVVRGSYRAIDLAGRAGQSLETLGGSMLPIRTEGTDLMVGDATVRQPDIEASNGVIHEIDAVLMPPRGRALPPGVEERDEPLIDPPVADDPTTPPAADEPPDFGQIETTRPGGAMGRGEPTERTEVRRPVPRQAPSKQTPPVPGKGMPQAPAKGMPQAPAKGMPQAAPSTPAKGMPQAPMKG